MQNKRTTLVRAACYTYTLLTSMQSQIRTQWNWETGIIDFQYELNFDQTLLHFSISPPTFNISSLYKCNCILVYVYMCIQLYMYSLQFCIHTISPYIPQRPIRFVKMHGSQDQKSKWCDPQPYLLTYNSIQSLCNLRMNLVIFSLLCHRS